MKKLLEIALCLIFAGCAIGFGGVQPLAYSLAEVFLFLAIVLMLWAGQRRGKISVSVPIWPLLFALLVILQIVPLPQTWVAGASSIRGADLAVAIPAAAGSSWTTLSIDPHSTVVALLRFLACLAAFILAASLFDSARRRSRIVWTLVALGSVEAIYGIFQYLLDWNHVLTFTNFYDRWAATGTYVNRNHYAGLLEMVFPLTFGLAFYSYQVWAESRKGHFVSGRGAEASAGQRTILYLFMGLLILLGIVFSRSRSGILAAALSLLVLVILSVVKIRRKGWTLGVVGFAAVVLGFGVWIGLTPVLARFEATSQGNILETSPRIPIWKDSLEIVRTHPLAGTGLGTFEQAFRPRQTGLVSLAIHHAHSDYLEFASETGLIGAALLFVPIFYLLIRMGIAFLDDHRRYRRAVLLGCIGSTLALLVHSATDFNLQLPANAIIFAVILGIGYKAACLEPAAEARQKSALVN